MEQWWTRRRASDVCIQRSRLFVVYCCCILLEVYHAHAASIYDTRNHRPKPFTHADTHGTNTHLRRANERKKLVLGNHVARRYRVIFRVLGHTCCTHVQYRVPTMTRHDTKPSRGTTRARRGQRRHATRRLRGHQKPTQN